MFGRGVILSFSFLEEVRYYLILANDLDYAQTESLLKGLNEAGCMLSSFIKTISKKV